MPTPILMPALSPTMEEGKLAKWHVKVGDRVKSGDVIAEIETDKATMEVEAVDEGVVADLIVPEGAENVKVNAVIAQLRDENEKYSPGAKPAPSAALAPKQIAPTSVQAPAKVAAKSEPSAPATPAPAVAAPKPAAAAVSQASGPRVFASPLARRIATQSGVELTLIHGSGPHGRIVKSDIDTAAKGGTPVRAPAARPAAVATAPGAAPTASALPDARLFYPRDSYEEIPHDSMRKSIAKRLTASKRDIPHYYLQIDCALDALVEIRKSVNEKAPKDGPGAYKLSVNDFVVKAAALALIRVPGSIRVGPIPRCSGTNMPMWVSPSRWTLGSSRRSCLGQRRKASRKFHAR